MCLTQDTVCGRIPAIAGVQYERTENRAPRIRVRAPARAVAEAGRLTGRDDVSRKGPAGGDAERDAGAGRLRNGRPRGSGAGSRHPRTGAPLVCLTQDTVCGRIPASTRVQYERTENRAPRIRIRAPAQRTIGAKRRSHGIPIRSRAPDSPDAAAMSHRRAYRPAGPAAGLTAGRCRRCATESVRAVPSASSKRSTASGGQPHRERVGHDPGARDAAGRTG